MLILNALGRHSILVGFNNLISFSISLPAICGRSVPRVVAQASSGVLKFKKHGLRAQEVIALSQSASKEGPPSLTELISMVPVAGGLPLRCPSNSQFLCLFYTYKKLSGDMCSDSCFP